MKMIFIFSWLLIFFPYIFLLYYVNFGFHLIAALLQIVAFIEFSMGIFFSSEMREFNRPRSILEIIQKAYKAHGNDLEEDNLERVSCVVHVSLVCIKYSMFY